MLLRKALPEDHLSADSKDMVRLGTGLIATMAALVLGLLIGAAQTSLSSQRSEFTQMSANIIVLDRILVHYGPEAREIRELLRRTVMRLLNQIQPDDGSGPGKVEPTAVRGEILYDKLQALRPQGDPQRSLQTQALGLMLTIGHTRWLMFEHASDRFPCRSWWCWCPGSPSSSSRLACTRPAMPPSLRSSSSVLYRWRVRSS